VAATRGRPLWPRPVRADAASVVPMRAYTHRVRRGCDRRRWNDGV